MTMTDLVLFFLTLGFPLLPDYDQAVLDHAMIQVAGKSPYLIWRRALLQHDDPQSDQEAEERLKRMVIWSLPCAKANRRLKTWWPVQECVIRRIGLYYDMGNHVWYQKGAAEPPVMGVIYA